MSGYLARIGNLSLLLAFFLYSYPGISQFYNTEVEAAIHIDIQNETIYTFVGSANNKTKISQELRYALSVIQTDDDENKKKNAQEGRIVLEPNAKRNLSETTLNIDNSDRTIILLLIYDVDDHIIGKDRKIVNGFEGEADGISQKHDVVENKDLSDTGEDGFVLRGVVVEDTKTKAGNDFYDMFYSSYLANNINGEAIVKVEEQLAIANNTQIRILVGNEVVVQFFVNPRNQYLKTMAEQSIYRVNAYFQKLKTERNQIIRY